MDTLNQALLYFGLKEAERPADSNYAFGHGQKKYLWNLGSAVGLFSIGSGIGLMHAYHSYHQIGETTVPETFQVFGEEVRVILIVVAVLLFAMLLEGYSFLVAITEFYRKMRKSPHSSFFSYLMNADDPTLVAIVLEDSLAVFGLSLAMTGIGLSYVTGNPLWDVLFSGIIALLLGVVAIFLLVINAKYLTAIRDNRAEQSFIDVVNDYPEIERYHDLRSIVIDESNTILVAEVEIREESMMAGLVGEIDELIEEMILTLPESKKSDDKVITYIRTRAAVESTLKRTETIIEDIVARVKSRSPQVSHCTIEVEGIAPQPESHIEA
ncbi:MAG: cation transporter, partial [Chromatiales bacterium]|nr:cation transporter [Chromatiales bacterium]